MAEVENEVKVYLVELTCDSCGVIISNQQPTIVLDNKGDNDLSNDTISNKYTCVCGSDTITDKLYPYPRYEKI